MLPWDFAPRRGYSSMSLYGPRAMMSTKACVGNERETLGDLWSISEIHHFYVTGFSPSGAAEGGGCSPGEPLSHSPIPCGHSCFWLQAGPWGSGLGIHSHCPSSSRLCL